MIEKLPELVNGDERLVWRGWFFTVDFLVEVGDVPYYISIQSGSDPQRVWDSCGCGPLALGRSTQGGAAGAGQVPG